MCPADGRYADKVSDLRDILSEYGLIRYRVLIEVRWLQWLADEPGIPEMPPLSPVMKDVLNRIVDDFTVDDAERIKKIEATTNHDVKAVEYFIRERIGSGTDSPTIGDFIHFGCTSEDSALGIGGRAGGVEEPAPGVGGRGTRFAAESRRIAIGQSALAFDDVNREARSFSPDLLRHPGVVEAAPLARDEEVLRFELPRDEAELAMAIDGENRVLHRAQPREGRHQHQRLVPGRQHPGDASAVPDAQL